MKRSEIIIAIALMVPVIWLVLVVRSWWWMDVVPEQSYRGWPTWVHPIHLSMWAFEFAWSFILGLVVGSLVRREISLQFAGLCGALEGAVHFAFTQNYFPGEVPVSLYFWAYGTYVVPVIGAIVGAFLSGHRVRFGSQRAA